MAKEIRFASCFICEVAISDESVELVDSGHQSFYIYKADIEAFSQFKKWFVDVYKACIPQTLTVLQYEPMHDDETGGQKLKVMKMFWRNASKPVINESKDIA